MSAEDELARLERRVLGAGQLGVWLKAVDTLRVLLAMGEPDIKAIVLAMSLPSIDAQARAAVLDAFGIGAADALAIVEAAGISGIQQSGKPSKTALALVKGLDKAGRKAMAQAVTLARAGADDETVLAPLFGQANSVRGRIIEAVNMSGNEGSTAVADAAGLATVWVAETDACVHCLAYSGQVARPGKTFPGGLTYGKKSYYPARLRHPPLHPRCRCTVEPLNDQGYADALRREADRSVLRGFSLPSESMGVRIDAAQRLLDKGVEAPKSVIKFAEVAVRRGRFNTRGRPAK